MASFINLGNLFNPFEMNRQALLDYVAALFADNTSEAISPLDARNAFYALIHSGLLKKSDVLTPNQLKGGTHYKNTLAERDAIEPALRVVNMSCVVTNPGTAEELLLGTALLPNTYQLVKSGGNAYRALVGLTGTATVNARWVQTSGSEFDRIRTYPVFQPEDFPYEQGDPIQFTFENAPYAGQTLLFEAKRDMNDFFNPEPTGLVSDPNWKAFAPLSAPGYVGYQEISVGQTQQLVAARQVEENRLYRVKRYEPVEDNGNGFSQAPPPAAFDVLLRGLSAGTFEPEAYRITNLSGEAEEEDITPGTYALASDVFTAAAAAGLADNAVLFRHLEPALQALLGGPTGDADTVINSLRELLALFASMSEGQDMAQILSVIQGRITTLETRRPLPRFAVFYENNNMTTRESFTDALAVAGSNNRVLCFHNADLGSGTVAGVGCRINLNGFGLNFNNFNFTLSRNSLLSGGYCLSFLNLFCPDAGFSEVRDLTAMSGIAFSAAAGRTILLHDVRMSPATGVRFSGAGHYIFSGSTKEPAPRERGPGTT